MLRLWLPLLLAALTALGRPSGVAAVRPAEGLAWPPYALERSVCFGDYAVCVWASCDASAPSFYRVVTIEREGEVLACMDWVTGLGELSGTDIDGSGWPNVIVEAYSGGAHCCFATTVYDLAENLVSIELPPSPGGNATAEFVDLDGDRVCEVLTADDSFAYTYCAYAGSPAVRAVLTYDALGQRYMPTSFLYPELYVPEIRRDTERARAALSTGADLGWDGTPKCEVLPLVLDLLYSGDPDGAWRALEAYYP
ncbi:MAG: hypothetical protein Q8M76_16555, partial [Spirochaetaceae bacterium]|nr:hypothetical protein [Spirochaetaceae bacterium]